MKIEWLEAFRQTAEMIFFVLYYKILIRYFFPKSSFCFVKIS
jgi:hypothetical protein